jgi:hypothetical protein
MAGDGSMWRKEIWSGNCIICLLAIGGNPTLSFIGCDFSTRTIGGNPVQRF